MIIKKAAIMIQQWNHIKSFHNFIQVYKYAFTASWKDYIGFRVWRIIRNTWLTENYKKYEQVAIEKGVIKEYDL